MYLKKISQAILITVALVLMTSCGVGRSSKPDGGTAANTPEVSQPAAGPASAEESQPADKPAPSEETQPAGTDEGVTLYPAALDIPSGRSIALEADIGGGQKAEWTSSDTSVATVSQDGAVSALSAGEALITVSSGSNKGTCRLTVTEGGTTLAYPEDPGSMDQDGKRETPDNAGENFPVVVPDNQDRIDKTLFKDNEYCWQFIIDDKFDTKLSVPMSDISYTVNVHAVLDAHKVGGDRPMGDYEGTMKMEMGIDKESFLRAMKAAGIPATDFNTDLQVQTVDVNFSVVTYDLDKINSAKYAFAPSGTIPVNPLTQIFAMAISSAQTSTSGNMDMQAEEGYGSAIIANKAGKISLVIEAGPNGEATLYLPKMLSMSNRDWFIGRLARMRLLDVK